MTARRVFGGHMRQAAVPTAPLEHALLRARVAARCHDQAKVVRQLEMALAAVGGPDRRSSAVEDAYLELLVEALHQAERAARHRDLDAAWSLLDAVHNVPSFLVSPAEWDHEFFVAGVLEPALDSLPEEVERGLKPMVDRVRRVVR